MRKLTNVRSEAIIVVKRHRADYTVRAEFTIIPGEPCIPYLPDGSGYPGSPSEIDDIECEVLEAEFYHNDGSGGPVETGDYEYRDRADLGDWATFADRACRSILDGGKYDDELFEGAGDNDYDF